MSFKKKTAVDPIACHWIFNNEIDDIMFRESKSCPVWAATIVL